MVEAESRISGEQQAEIAEHDATFAFVYANWAIKDELGPDDPIDESLLTRLVARSTELSIISEADKSNIKLRIEALLADPEIRHAKFDEAYDFRKRQKEMSERAARMRFRGQA